MENLEKVQAALKHLPDFQDIPLAEAKVTRLGGMTNLVYLVERHDQKVVVRIPGEGTEAYIDRSVDVHNARAAEKAGVSPAVLWADEKTGAMITRAVLNIETMSPEKFKSRSGAPRRAGAVLAKLHKSGQTFTFRFELFSMIEEYLRVLSTKDIALPEGYHEVVAAAGPMGEALNLHPVPLAPCHCDPLCENFLDDGERMWLVDWEYSGMNDPLWDLGDVAIEAEMDEAQEVELLEGYFGRPPTAAERGRVVIYKAMCDLLWTLWGLIQVANDNPALDFRAYADGRFARCRNLMQHPSFQDHVAAVRKG